MAKKSFEQSLKQLEQIVHELESGELPLEQAIRKFEEGIELSKFCAQKLEETERKITLLMQVGGAAVEKPFAPAGEDGQ
jgi:exodeoxyribonuclease VII small subunit